MYDIKCYAKKLKVKDFRGVFMRQLLPTDKPHYNECGILNLGDLESNGTHWTCYVKHGADILYFDSHGSAYPCSELVEYLNANDGSIRYNIDRIQEFDDPPICGHLCLEVLNRQSEYWKELIDKLRDDKYAWLRWWNTL